MKVVKRKNGLKEMNWKEYDHIASNYDKKFCNYYKQHGHIIKEYSSRPQNHKINVFQAGTNASASDNSSSTGAARQVLSLEMIQQMIVSPFLALRLQGNDIIFNFWPVDSGTSNHMTNSASILKNVREYHDPSQI